MEDEAGPICTGCTQLIEEGSVIAFGDSLFHLGCFVCAKCSQTVDYNSNLLLLTDGRPVCESCSYNCALCKKSIHDEAVMTGDEAYHAECFKCVSCNKKIDDLVYTQTSKADKQKRREERERQKNQIRQLSQDSQLSIYSTYSSHRQLRLEPISSPIGNDYTKAQQQPRTLLDTRIRYENRSPLQPNPPGSDYLGTISDRPRSNSVDITTKSRLDHLLSPTPRLHGPVQPTPSRSEVVSSSRPSLSPNSLSPHVNNSKRYSKLPPPLQLGPIERSRSVPGSPCPSNVEPTSNVRCLDTSLTESSLSESRPFNLSFFDDSPELLDLTKTLGASFACNTSITDKELKDFSNSASTTKNINKASEILRSSLNLSSYDKSPQLHSPLIYCGEQDLNDYVSTSKEYVLNLQSELRLTNRKLVSMEANFNQIKEASKLALEEFTRAKEEFSKEAILRQKYENTSMHLQQQLVIMQQLQSSDYPGVVRNVKEDTEKIVRVRLSLEKSCSELKECRNALFKESENLFNQCQNHIFSLPTNTTHITEHQKALISVIKSLAYEKDALKSETERLSKIREDVIHEMVVLNTKNAELSTMNNDLSRRMSEREREALAVMAGTSFLHSPTPSRSTESHSSSLTPRKLSDTTIRKVAARDSFNGKQAPKVFKIKKRAGGTIFGKRSGKNNKTDPTPINCGEAYSTNSPPVPVRGDTRQGVAQSRPQDGHAFQPTSFLRPTKCDACGEKMWGLSELRCQCCGYITHAKCLSHVPQLCFAGTVSTLDLLGTSEIESNINLSMFGTNLSVQTALEDRDVPILVEKCITAVETRGMNYEGIYRKSGGAAQIKAIQHAFNQGLNINLEDEEEFNDICAVTSVLKQYFRELPDPLITFDLYPKFIDLVSMTSGDAKLDKFTELISQLPPVNYATMKELIQHLHRVQLRDSENLMTTKNLAMVFGPTLMNDKDSSRNLLDMNYKNAAIEFIISQAFKLFS
ncbi:hypothetical protein BDF14DRAFT_1827946 [Spinellus fusiger]|nr:hypothetical protein BDF14DRAFT_1827946 [Spinellus fusiger]